MAKYSFIIPAYNAEHTIIKCLDSISSQSVDDYEVVVVNDGSVDNTAACVEVYAQSNPKVQLYSKENGGVSSARNLGIDKSRGNHIIFVDADDYISSDYLVYAEQISGYDWILFLAQEESRHDVRTMHPVDRMDDARQQCVFPYVTGGSQDLTSYRLSAPWSKVYSSEIIKGNRLRFDENLIIGEDAYFNLKYISYVQTAICINRNVYHYCDNDLSVTRRFKKNYIQIDTAYQKAIYEYNKLASYDNLGLYRLLSALNGAYHCVGGYFGHKDNHKKFMESYREWKEYLSNEYYFEDFNQYKDQVKIVYGSKKYLFFQWLKSRKCIFLLNLVTMCLRVLRRIR